jgi:two-component system, OmpR family, sensor histidine kinase BaeS
VRSIQRRFFGAFLVVVLVAVGTVAVIVLRSATTEIERYDRLANDLEMTRIAHWLTGYFEVEGDWSEVQPYLDEIDALSGRRVVITDERGRVVADTSTDASESPFDRSWPSRELTFDHTDSPVSRVYLSREVTIVEQFRSRMVRSIRHALLVASIVAIALALLASLLLSRPLSAPIGELVTIGQRAGRGDFSTRVRVPRDAELATLALTLNKMMVDLQVAAELRSNMVADIAHELRTPLTNIRGYLEAKRDGIVPDEVSTSIIESETAVLVRLVDDLQDLAMADAGALKLNRETIDLTALIRNTLQAMVPAATRQQIHLEFPAENGAVAVTADPIRISQVLTILLTNAMQHSPRDGTIAITLTVTGAVANVSVRDTGEGIPPQLLPHVFERFYRVDPSRSRETGGYGLGLTIAKHLVEAHGGTIDATSEIGRGTCFSFALPL